MKKGSVAGSRQQERGSESGVELASTMFGLVRGLDKHGTNIGKAESSLLVLRHHSAMIGKLSRRENRT